MSSDNQISLFSVGLIILLTVMLPGSSIASMSPTQGIDSVYSINAVACDLNQAQSDVPKRKANFYRTDSIFSFQSDKGYLPSLLNNFGKQVTAPFKFSKKQWLITGGAVGITAVLLHFDNDIDKWARVQKQKHGWINKASPQITLFGSAYAMSTVAAAGLISAAIKNEKGVQTSLLATQALITSAAWAQLIKHFTGREDPSATYIYSKKPGGQWWGPFAQYDQDLPVYKSVSSFDAFPSGHTAAAFSIATVFATQYKDIKAVPIISYSLATLVGISRLTEHAHWTSDIFVGGLIGYVCGKQVTGEFNKIHQKSPDGAALMSRNGAGLTFIQNGNQLGFCFRW
jgi:membrane-associated phospholipid phosphatase